MRSFRGYSAISVWFKRSRDVFAGYRVVYAREFRAKAMRSLCAGAANSLTIVPVRAWVVSDLIGNPEDSFSYDAAHFNSEMYRTTDMLRFL